MIEQPRSLQMTVHPHNPTEEELRQWAYAPDSEEPVQDWGMILSWQMDRGLLRHCIEFADDGDCPQAAFFLDVLYQWVCLEAGRASFEATRDIYDEWLNVAKGIRDPAVKRWRHHARLIFQGLEPFDSQKWWKLLQSDNRTRADEI